ncbi:unnamed protein product [Plutella xylostella]|uniref:(diamondback moth) hypothetical protein n=1 Tax=Plutella xylostella TaxID=51655 RepID=A0A8S4EQ65_PLUXY|nr:unnamed protein product [Plutella xylostella]
MLFKYGVQDDFLYANYNPDSSGESILIPGLVWTSSQHGPLSTRTPDLKPSSEPDLRVAGLQETPRSQSKEVAATVKCGAFEDGGERDGRGKKKVHLIG